VVQQVEAGHAGPDDDDVDIAIHDPEGIGTRPVRASVVKSTMAVDASALVPPARITAVEGTSPATGSVNAGDPELRARFDAAGFVEVELFVDGVADALDGVGRVLDRAHPYTTRIVVRRPRDPGPFSGVVFVEPFHHIAEQPVVWPWMGEWIVARGHAWIGVTVHTGSFTHHYGMPGGVPFLQAADPERYSPLHLDQVRDPPPRRMQIGPGGFDPVEMMWAQAIGHAQGTGIVGALGRLLGANAPDSPLAGFDVGVVCGVGASQTGNFWRTFLDWGVHEAARLADGTPAFDAYLTLVCPRPERTPDDAIFVNVLSEAEVVGTLNPRMMSAPPASDEPPVRGYEITGAAHGMRASGTGIQPGDHSAIHTDEPFEMLLRAIAESLVRWLLDGTPMPVVAPIARDARRLDGVARDDHGNAIGGLRAPWIEVAAAQYLPRC
jgi:hypothetical protein